MNDKTKKCPHCGQEIPAELNFCHYCMKPLNEKTEVSPKLKNKRKTRTVILITVLTVIVLIVCLVLLFLGKKGKTDRNKTTLHQEAPTFSDEKPKTEDDGKLPSAPTEVTPTDENEPTATPSPSQPSSEEEVSPSEKPTEDNKEITEEKIIYLYRPAVKGDDYYQGKDFFNNEIVITGVKNPSKNGVYRIPETIDGKKVVVIAKYAFTGENVCKTVKKVYIPATVKTVDDYSFVNCFNLSDIYLYGTSVHINTDAFPESNKRNQPLTIHCSKDCDNRNFYYYKNIAKSDFNAEYEEWNG